MSATCDQDAEPIAAYLGFSCEDSNAFVSLRNPADLQNWTLPVLEWTIVALAVAALVFAVQRVRRHGDPTHLVLWFASLVFLFAVEPALYFPRTFLIQDTVGLTFLHNVFTVDFMFDRMPLYIVAIYPALSVLSYELVRSLGIFARRGAAAGAITVAFVNSAFYEIFDQLGPQLRWWAWNLDNQVNEPMLASVPMNSIVLFSAVSFGLLAYLAVRFVGIPTWAGRRPSAWSTVGRTVAAGLLVPVGMVVAAVPVLVFGGDTPNVTAQRVVCWLEILALLAFGGRTLWQGWQDQRSSGGSESMTWYAKVCPLVYLGVFATLWLTALPDFLGASNGVTDDGGFTGSLAYTAYAFVVATLAVAALWTAGRVRAPSSEPVVDASV